MEKLTVYHNPSCNKSTGALEILDEKKVDYDVIEYLKTPPSEAQIRQFLELLGCEPKELIHPGPFGQLGRNIDDYNTPDAVVALLLEHPEVMIRPIIIRGKRAVIARPSVKVNEILD